MAPLRCVDCRKVHRHRDGALFCTVYAARVSKDSLPPEHCRHWGRRTGGIPKAAASGNSATGGKDPNEYQEQEWGNLYREQGGRL